LGFNLSQVHRKNSSQNRQDIEKFSEAARLIPSEGVNFQITAMYRVALFA
jgi:hypothetical protein